MTGAASWLMAALVPAVAFGTVPATAANPYPPDENLAFGTASGTFNYINGNPQFICGLDGLITSRLWGSGAGFATMSFGTSDFYYSYTDEPAGKPSNIIEVEFGGTAWLDYTSPADATITFDFADTVFSAGKPPKIGRSFPVTIDSASYANGFYHMSFTIQFPNCPAAVDAGYRAP